MGWLSPKEEEEESLQTPGAINFPEAHCMHEPVPERRAQSLWDGRRCCTHPDQWWLLGISLNQPGPQD